MMIPFWVSDARAASFQATSPKAAPRTSYLRRHRIKVPLWRTPYPRFM
jgi:hypothetical protein